MTPEQTIKEILTEQLQRIKPEISNLFLFDIQVRLEQRRKEGLEFSISAYLPHDRIQSYTFDEMVEKCNSYDAQAEARKKTEAEIERLKGELAKLTATETNS